MGETRAGRVQSPPRRQGPPSGLDLPRAGIPAGQAARTAASGLSVRPADDRCRHQAGDPAEIRADQHRRTAEDLQASDRRAHVPR